MTKMVLTKFTRWNTCTGAKFTFTGTDSNNMIELQTRWWIDFERSKTISDKNDLDEMCVWLGTNLPHKTRETLGRSLLIELERSLDDRLAFQGSISEGKKMGEI